MTARTLVFAFRVCMAVGALVFSTSSSAADDDPAQGTVWDLSPLFRDDSAWDKERLEVRLVRQLEAVAQSNESSPRNGEGAR